MITVEMACEIVSKSPLYLKDCYIKSVQSDLKYYFIIGMRKSNGKVLFGNDPIYLIDKENGEAELQPYTEITTHERIKYFKTQMQHEVPVKYRKADNV